MSGAQSAARSGARSAVRRPGLLLLACGVLLGVAVLSLFVGSRPVPSAEVWDRLWSPDDSQASTVVHDLRLPRTVVALVVGAALGVAGALMQSLTRNPLADPGILGINAGASLAVVIGVVVAGAGSTQTYVVQAFAGALLAMVVVYVLGSVGRTRASPARLALAGVAVSAAIGALVQTLILADAEAFNEFRFWAAGSLENRGFGVLAIVGPVVAIALLVAVLMAPALNALALGEETARSVGVRVLPTRIGVMVVVALLCGAATAAAGPIGFVGLGVPFLARALCGSDQRWVLPFCVVLGPVVLLAADVLARVVVSDEAQVGIVTALLGGPLFIALVRRPRIEAL